MKALVVVCLLFSLSLSGESVFAGDPANVERAFGIVEAGYPGYRRYWGLFYSVGGAYSVAWGLTELFSASQPLPILLGFGLAFTGGLCLFDGIGLLQWDSQAEIVLNRYRKYAPGTAEDFGGVVSREEFGRTRLQLLSDDAYTGRVLRLGSHLVSAAAFFYFYGVGADKGSNYLLVPGILMTGAALFRLLQSAPEERAAMSLGGALPNASFRIVPSIGGVWAIARF